METVLRAADEHGTGVPLDHLAELLPSGAPQSPGGMVDWLARHAPSSPVVRGRAYLRAPGGDDLESRRARGTAYLSAARDVFLGPLGPMRALVQCVGVTGSVAYGEPVAGDDCDFLVVTRTGAVWAFLAFTYIRLRLAGDRVGAGTPSTWCFNYVLDDRSVRREFVKPRGFLFAREALTARMLHGDEYYRALLGRAGWLEGEAPRLYDRWKGAGFPEIPPVTPAPWAVRFANALLFGPVAAYLQIVGLVRNRRLRRSGRGAERFRTITRWSRLAFESEKFGRLTELYAPASAIAPQP